MMTDANGHAHMPKGSAGSTGGRFANNPNTGSEDLPPLEAPVNPLRSAKGLSALLYRMGRTFDGLNTTRMATEEFLRTGNPNVIGSKNDYALLLDLRDAAKYVLETDFLRTALDLDWFKGINASMTRTAAMEPGILRTAENIVVHTSNGPYVPPVPEPEKLQTMLESAANAANDPLDRASQMFSHLAKAQPFGDGNKRSALLAANGLLLREHTPLMFAVPADEPEREEFNRLLGRWYLHGDDHVIGWLSAWNQHERSD